MKKTTSKTRENTCLSVPARRKESLSFKTRRSLSKVDKKNNNKKKMTEKALPSEIRMFLRKRIFTKKMCK